MKAISWGMAILFVGAGIFWGCSSTSSSSEASGDSSSAGFKVQLSAGSGLSAVNKQKPLAATPATSLTAKLGGVDLLAECTGGNPPGTCLDSGLDPDPDIWVNSGCNDDIAQCTTSNTEFFELIDPTAANVTLNSQGRSIEPGTFTHVRIYFLNNDLADAIQCNGIASAARPVIPITVALPSNLTVEAGQSVTVTLTYDLSSVDCDDQSTIETAISAITATATLN